MRAVLGVRDFLLLWLGQATSMLGDQFHGIAGSWLVLKMTGDPLALGTVMAAGGIPRAVFILIGGAITDHVSPRRVMIFADVVRMTLTAAMTFQVFTGTLQIWMIYVYSLIGGIVGGLFGPASMSIVPRILPSKDLQAGNSLTQGSSSLIGFLGPAAAGGLIAAFADVRIGVTVALAFDVLTFVVSLVTLSMMRSGSEGTITAQNFHWRTVFSSVGAGIGWMLKDHALRLMFGIIAVANLAFGGAIVVGIPYLADTRFPEGAAAYGVILSGYAGGNLLGIVLSGALPKFSKKVMQVLMTFLFLVFGVGVGALGWITVTWLAAFDMFVMGVLNGYMSILFITGLQRNTPQEMLGRLMSLLLLANMALVPLAQAVAGAVLRWNVLALFIAAAVMLLAATLYLVLPGQGSTLVERLSVD